MRHVHHHRFSACIELRFYLPVPIAGTVGQAKRVGHHHGIPLQTQRIRLVVIKVRIGLHAPFTADLAVRTRVREYRDAEILHRLLRRRVLPMVSAYLGTPPLPSEML